MLTTRLGINEIDDVDIVGKRVLMRVNYDMPLVYGEFVGSKSIAPTIPTINKLFERGAWAIVLLSSLGDPRGEFDLRFSLDPAAEVLSEILGDRPVYFIRECFGENVEKYCSDLAEGSVTLLENVQFRPEEAGSATIMLKPYVPREVSVKRFRASLSKLGDIFVNEAFSYSHFDHSSIAGISIPLRVAGLLFEQELRYFAHVLEPKKRPVLAIMGGENLGRKVSMINHLLDKVDMMIIGGALVYTFLSVTCGMEIGKSTYDIKGAKAVSSIIQKAKQKRVQLFFPEDFICYCPELPPEKVMSVSEGIPCGWAGIDIGPKTIELFGKPIAQAKAILLYGTQGAMRSCEFTEGSLRMLDKVIDATKNGCISVVAGHSAPHLVRHTGSKDLVSHVTDGVVATRVLLSGQGLPGVAALSAKKKWQPSTPNNKEYLSRKRKKY